MVEFEDNTKKGPGTGALVCICVVLGAAVIGLIVGVAILGAQLSAQKDNKAPTGDGKKGDSDGQGGVVTTTPMGGVTTTKGGATTTMGGATTTKDGATTTIDGADKPVPSPEQLSMGKYAKAAVSSENEVCNRIGASMLARGGSVVDAIIATQLCTGVMSPEFSGIGGGFMLTVYDKAKNGTTKKVKTLLARETAPAAATEEMFVDASSVEGGLAIGIPSEIAGHYEAWQQYGRLPWKDLFTPSIKLARDGVPVSGAMAFGMIIAGGKEKFEQYEALGDMYLDENGELLKEGDVVKMEKLAVTLETIANEGKDAFYDGSLTSAIVKEIQDAGGIITAEDLAGYKAIWRDPVSTTLDNGKYTMYGPPPPSSECVIQFMMNILDGYNYNSAQQSGEAQELLKHQMIEAFKFGYGKRSTLGDRDFVDVEELITDLTTGAFGDSYRLKISDEATSSDYTYYEPDFLKSSSPTAHTSHISVIGEDGSAASMTATINTFYGSLVVGPTTGIVYNNQMDDFSTPNKTNFFGFLPSESNFVVPGKRPMSSTSPTLVLDEGGKVRVAIGSAGGSRIISSIMQSLINILWLDMPVDEALADPRLHHQLLPDKIEAEPNMPQSIIDSLKARNHSLSMAPGHLYMGLVMAVKDQCAMCAADDTECYLNCVTASTDWRSKSRDIQPQAAMPAGY